ncbi:fibronectin type III domain-containing protein [Paenibacillus sp. 1P07SE]|uniref:fibronectin type III domain-containing protein n=1 Tax=Paenibacillus sp. 1P07SE TaxID=3132209 RepID=UPI0039A59B96
MRTTRIHQWMVLSLSFVLVWGLAAAALPAAGSYAAGAESGLQLYVAADGSDETGDGSEGSPYQSLTGARDAIRALKSGSGLPAGGVTVNLRDGDYRLPGGSFDLTAEDSGTADAPVVYRSYPGETARLTGGASVDAGSFVPVTDAEIASRLTAEAQERVIEIDLLEQGITREQYGDIVHYGQGWPLAPAMMELFIDSQEMELGRYPNDGWLTMDSIVDPGLAGNAGGVNQGPTFVYNDEENRASRWSEADDAWMFGYYFYDWAEENMKVAELDPATNTVKGQQSAWWGINPDLTHRRFYFYNLLEEVDQPGEWYLDRDTGKLYLYPPDDFGAESRVELSLDGQPLIRANDASHVHIVGLELSVTRGTAIRINGGSHMLVADNHISNTGMHGVDVRGGSHHGVTGNEIHHTGTGGVLISGGDRPSLTSSGHYVLNNHIHAYSRIKKTYAPGIRLEGVGIRAAYNVIHDSDHYAINFSGNDHIIEYNEIFDVLKDSNDSGAIYAARDYSFWGNIIRYNYMHDIIGREGHTVQGAVIYTDDNVSGTEVYGNIMENVGIPFYTHGGRSNKIYENIIINPIHFYVRGIKYGGQGATVPGYSQDSLNRLLAMPHDSALWRAKYPEMASIIEDLNNGGVIDPKYNVFTNNIILNGKDAPAQLHPQLTQYGHFDGNYFVDAPADTFMDWENGDYRIKPGAELYEEIAYHDAHQDRSGLLESFKPQMTGDVLNRLFLTADQPLYNTASLYAAVGDTVQLGITARSDRGRLIPGNELNIDFASDQPSVAAVDTAAGEVSALAEGTSTIRATVTRNGVTRSIETELHVVPEAPELAAVELELGGTELEIGNVRQALVRWTNQYGQALDLTEAETTYVSDAPQVAAIDAAGRLEALAPGEAGIRVSTTYEGREVHSEEIRIEVAGTTMTSINAALAPGYLQVGQAADLQIRANLSNDTTITPSSDQVELTIEQPEVAAWNEEGQLVGLQPGGTFVDVSVTYQGVTLEKKVHLSVYESTANQVPSPWSVTNFSNTGRSGFAQAEEGRFWIVSSGDSMLEANDNVTFVNRGMTNTTERYAISATLHSLEEITPNTAAGLHMRGSINEPGSKSATLQVTADGRIQLLSRLSFQGGVFPKTVRQKVSETEEEPVIFELPVEIKLEKRQSNGNQFTFAGYVRTEQGWTEVVSQSGYTFNASNNLTSGMTLVSDSHKSEAIRMTEAVFSNLVVEQGEVSKLTLSDTILEATALHDEAVEGAGAEEYPQGSKAELMTAIQAARQTLDQANAGQPAIDAAAADLTSAVADFKALQGTGGEPQEPGEPGWPAGSSVTATSVSSDSITLQWTAAAPAESISGYRIVWADGSEQAEAGQLSHTVNGLEPATSYTFRVEAQADDAWLDGGPEITVQTLEAEEQQVPTAWLTGSAIAAPEQTIRLSYRLTGVAQSRYPAIYAQHLELTYDPDALEFIEAVDALSGLQVIVPDEQQPGELELALYSQGESGAVVADGRQLDLIFRAKSGGQTTVSIVSAAFSDQAGQEMNGHVTAHTIDIRDITTDDLSQTIATAQALHDQAVEGTWRLQYAEGAKAALLAAIEAARAVADDEEAEAEAIAAQLAALTEATAAFEQARNDYRPGDINGDGAVTVADLAIAAYYYGYDESHPDWASARFADLNGPDGEGDGKIDVFDLSVIGRYLFN